MAYSPLINSLDETQIKSVGGGGAGGGMVAAGVISGLADMATGFINAQRTKNAYKFNRGMMEIQGRVIRLAADEEIKNIRAKAQSLVSTQQALYAKAGVALTGSPLEVMFDTIKNAELDAIFTGINADLGIMSTETQAGIYGMAGKSAGYDAWTNAFKSILTMANKQYMRG